MWRGRHRYPHPPCGEEAGTIFLDALGLIAIGTSLGGVSTVAQHVASTTHRQLDLRALEAIVSHDPLLLPANLPVPQDDGAADHLPGLRLPALALPATDGTALRVDVVPRPATRLVLYAYPRTGRPGVEPPPDWDLIPGARGCTPQSCAFRDHAAELGSAGAAVAGVSTQDTTYQREAVERLHLPFPLLSDADLALTRALRLPTFEVEGATLLRRLTLVVRDGAIEHVFYPVFPPDRHARVVLDWLAERPVH